MPIDFLGAYLFICDEMDKKPTWDDLRELWNYTKRENLWI